MSSEPWRASIVVSAFSAIALTSSAEWPVRSADISIPASGTETDEAPLDPIPAEIGQPTAIDMCRAEVVRPIALLDEYADGMSPVDTPPHISQGTIINRVTQYVVEEEFGLSGYCAHFGACYRATATENGQQVEAVRLLNCSVDLGNPYIFEDSGSRTIMYPLIPDPTLNSDHDMQVYRTFMQLLEIGIESEHLAMTAIDHPESRCGQLAIQALTGDQQAREGLHRAMFPPFGLTVENAMEYAEERQRYSGCL